MKKKKRKVNIYTTQVIISVSGGDELNDWDNWLDQHEEQIKLSENTGCGCCVDIFQVQGEYDLLYDIPVELRGDIELKE